MNAPAAPEALGGFIFAMSRASSRRVPAATAARRDQGPLSSRAVALRTLDHAARAAEPTTAAPATVELGLEQRLIEQLLAAPAPLTATALRKLCRVRNATLQAALTVLVEEGRVLKDRAGYALAR